MIGQPEVTPAPATPPRLGLAIASLVLGIIALVLSLVVVGGVLGLVGFILGVVHLRRHASGQGMAWVGIALSVLALVASTALGFFYYKMGKEFIAAAREAGASAAADMQQWEGVLAPEIEVTTLEGEKIKLSELRGKRVVVDFWATWCPPCVKEIPHFIQLYNETSREELALVGISKEDAETLNPFIKKHGVNYPIASAQELAEPYSEVRSIPTTFFIDRKGVIQSIAVGYHDFAAIKERALAADFEGEPKAAPAAPASELEESEEPLAAVEVWSTNIAASVALTAANWDNQPGEEILVVAGKQVHVLTAAGDVKETMPLPDSFATIEGGRYGNETRLLGYSNWGKNVSVVDRTGKELWSYSALMGVDGAHWGDLDGDGKDEMVVGMNGMGGLHAVSADGKKLWSAKGLGNVWNQAVIPASKDRPALIFATEAGGTVRVYDAKGKLQKTIRPLGKYCAQMTARVVGPDGEIQAMALGEGSAIAFDEKGQVAWSTPSVKDAGAWRGRTFAGGDINGDKLGDWVFRDPNGDLVFVSSAGEKLGSLRPGPGLADFIISMEKGEPRLITLCASTVTSYRFGPHIEKKTATAK
jgi:peroxiredoxin